MNRGKGSTARMRTRGEHGYTIVEVLIFLAVSALMFVAAAALISGRQAREQFTSGVRDFETSLADIANDVSTGYYQGAGPIRCDIDADAPKITPVEENGAIGTNDQCIFVGTMVKLGIGDGSGDDERFAQVAMAGRREGSGGQDVTSLDMANPRAITDVVTPKIIGGGVRVGCIMVGTSPGCDPDLNNNNGAIGFFTNFEGSDLASTTTGALRTNTYVYNDVVINETVSQAVDKAHGAIYDSSNPEITICLVGGINQYALVRIGGSGASNLTVTSEIRSVTGGNQACTV